jgi:branched-chain amino acid transport system permease protein
MFHQTPLRTATLVLLLVIGLVSAFTADYFGVELIAEIAILAIFVLSLDLVAGFGGMVSLCHGALLGVGAYTFAMLGASIGVPASLSMAGAIILTAAVAYLIGLICSRTHGIFFIMATLAFGQMLYSFVFESRLLGGDDGLSGVPRLDLSFIGIDMLDSRNFALLCLVAAVISYLAAVAMLRSGAGRTLVGVKWNEHRMEAVGLTVWKIKAAAFAFSGALTGLAGSLAAQHSMFVSPGLLNWTVSGEALVVVILGGIGTLVGPVVGAVVFVFLKHEISALTTHWHLFVGLILIGVVMAGGNGIYGQIEHVIRSRRQSGNEVPGVEGKKDA